MGKLRPGYWKEHYYRRKAIAIAKLGGKCVRCGTTDNLEFDHIDPSTKRVNFTSLLRVNNFAEIELAKCQLLCHEHHRDKTGRTEHGRWRMYQPPHNCRCIRCSTYVNTYMRDWKRMRRQRARTAKGQDCKP